MDLEFIPIYIDYDDSVDNYVFDFNNDGIKDFFRLGSLRF